MPIYPKKAEPFECAICGREGPPRWEIQILCARPPLCRGCEHSWGGGGYNEANPDRRTIRQVKALADIISATAHCIENGHEVPYGRT